MTSTRLGPAGVASLARASSRLIGPAVAEAPAATLPELVQASSTAFRGPWLIAHEGAQSTSYGVEEVAGLASRWALRLAHAGVGPEDRVVTLLPNGIDFVAAFLGIQQLGAVVVPVAWPFFFDSLDKKTRELEPLFQIVQPAALVTTEKAEGSRAWSFPVVTRPAPAEDFRSSHGTTSFASPDHPAFIQFTSGSTGRPRGAVISHRAAIASAKAMGRALGLSASDVGVSWLPLFHDMGLVGSLFSSLVHQFPLHLMTPSEFLLHPKRWLELITKTKATITVGPNFGYDTVTRRVRDLGGLDLSSLRYVLNGSEPVHRVTIDAFEQRFAPVGFRASSMLPVYGLAENTLGVTFSSRERFAPDLQMSGRSIPSVGVPIQGTEVEIRSSADHLLSEGEEGEIFVKSPSLMTGYYRDPESTAKTLRDGWLATGDMGVVLSGNLYITGREKELIIKGGQKFHPYEIERVVASLLGTGINQVAAFSVPNDEKGTEDLAVLIEMRSSTNDDVSRLVRGKLIDELGVRAERVELVSPGTIPRTTSGKLRRSACKDLLAEVQV